MCNCVIVYSGSSRKADRPKGGTQATMHPWIAQDLGGLTIKPQLAVVHAIAAHLVAHVLYAHTLHNAVVLQPMRREALPQAPGLTASSRHSVMYSAFSYVQQSCTAPRVRMKHYNTP